MHAISAKARLAPEVIVSAFTLGLAGYAWIDLLLEAGDGLGVSLVGSPQRLLRRQSKPGQQRTDRSQAQTNAKLTGDQIAHDGPGPHDSVN